MLISTSQAIRPVLGLAADTAFVLASKPPHTAKASEIERDDQALIDRSISGVHLFSSVVVYGLSLGQIWMAWRSGDVLSAVSGWGGQEWLGVGAMIFGGTLRLWCYRTLGRFFTFNLAIRKGHKLVTSGPYALLRHPSYTGLLAMVIGLSLRYTSSRSFLLPYLGRTVLRGSLVWACTLPLFALVRRIKQEERMLEKEFGDEWRQYCQKSWKLVPFIW